MQETACRSLPCLWMDVDRLLPVIILQRLHLHLIRLK